MFNKKSLKFNFLLSLLLVLLLFASLDYAQQEERSLQPQLTRDKSLFPLKSTGVWTEVHPLIPRVDYWGIDFANADLPTGQAGTGWAVGEGGAVIKTTNGGQKWIWYESGVENTLRTVASVNNGQRVIAAGDGGIIIISEDAGETWIQLSSPTTRNIWNLQMITDEIGWMVGERGTALKTTDGGLIWVQQSMPYPTAPYWDVSFIDTSFGYMCTSSGIVLKTTDGGVSWITQIAGDTRSLYTIYAIDTLRASAGGFAGKVVYTTDGGINWLNAGGGGISAPEINKIKFMDEVKGFLASSGGFYKSTNGGVSWYENNDLNQEFSSVFTTNLSLPTEEKGFVTGGKMLLAKTTNEGESWRRTIVNADLFNVYFKDEQNGFINSTDLIYTTNDGGQSLDTILTFPYNEIFSMEGMTFTDSLNGFIGTLPARIYKTTNGGQGWHRTNITGLVDSSWVIIKFFFLTKDIGWAISNKRIMKTNDGGENWFVQLNMPGAGYFSGIHFVDSLYGWISVLSRRPFKTTDGGENWTEQTNLNFYQTNDVYFKDTLNGWLLSENKLYRTNDGGITWYQDTQISAYTSRFKLISNTHFLITWNIYESIDTGNTWINIMSDVGTSFLNLYAPYNYFCVPIGVRGLVMNYLDTTIVPVELTGFKAELRNLNVLLSWQSATEKNNMGFEIQRSKNKVHWEVIGTVSGKGTTSERQNYSFEDTNIENQMYFYRLKQIDYNGLFKYSNIIEIKIYLNNFELFQNYPNPTNPTTIIKYIVPLESFIEMYLYDIKGEKVSTLIYENTQAGIYTKEIDLRELSTGVYFYTLKSSTGFSQTKKLLFIK
ncbi:MAG: T9SS type A sorting domain-containing protein [Ignavibacteriota bacterium]|nr:MAG: T9SS type A sorting domain-containing protein [Ignavibacteriota bacterium]